MDRRSILLEIFRWRGRIRFYLETIVTILTGNFRSITRVFGATVLKLSLSGREGLIVRVGRSTTNYRLTIIDSMLGYTVP